VTLLEQNELSRDADFRRRCNVALPVVTYDLVKRATPVVAIADRAAYIRKAATLPEVHRLVAGELVGKTVDDEEIEKACRRIVRALVIEEAA